MYLLIIIYILRSKWYLNYVREAEKTEFIFIYIKVLCKFEESMQSLKYES